MKLAGSLQATLLQLAGFLLVPGGIVDIAEIVQDPICHTLVADAVVHLEGTTAVLNCTLQVTDGPGGDTKRHMSRGRPADALRIQCCRQGLLKMPVRLLQLTERVVFTPEVVEHA